MIEPKLNVTALRNVCRALRESPDPTSFRMTSYAVYNGNRDSGHCNTPACCLGHYALRTDLQSTFTLDSLQNLRSIQDNRRIDFEEDPVLDHFGISLSQAYALFSATGCSNAKTPQQAIDYIEAFIASKEQSHG